MWSITAALNAPYTFTDILFTLLSSGLLICAITYIFNIIRISLAIRHDEGPQKPLPIPYAIPGLGNLIPWMFDSHILLLSLT